MVDTKGKSIRMSVTHSAVTRASDQFRDSVIQRTLVQTPGIFQVQRYKLSTSHVQLYQHDKSASLLLLISMACRSHAHGINMPKCTEQICRNKKGVRNLRLSMILATQLLSNVFGGDSTIRPYRTAVQLYDSQRVPSAAVLARAVPR